MAMLASMEVPTYTLPPNDEAARKVFEEALMVAKSGSRPVCLLAPPKTFSGTKAVAPIVSGASQPTREAASEGVLSQVCPEPSP